MLARGWADRNYHPPLTESADTVLRRIGPVAEAWHGAEDGRIRVGLPPLIPWGCSDGAIRATGAAWGGGRAARPEHCPAGGLFAQIYRPQ